MWSKRGCAARIAAEGRFRRSDLEGLQRRPPARNQHWAESVTRPQRVLNLAAWIAAALTASLGLLQTLTGHGVLYIGLFNIATAAVFLAIPLLHRFGDMIAALVFVIVSFTSLTFVGSQIGTDPCAVLLPGIGLPGRAGARHGPPGSCRFDRRRRCRLVIALQFLVPQDTGIQPRWGARRRVRLRHDRACLLMFATVWYAMREVERAEDAMEVEYKRSEALLANILPATVAEQLKDPAHGTIAHRYDDASVMFTDIAGYTERASDMGSHRTGPVPRSALHHLRPPGGPAWLEKIKTTGDGCMVVGGVPTPRPDHVEAIAALALDISKAVAGLRDPRATRCRSGWVWPPDLAGRRRRCAPVLLRRLGRRRQRRPRMESTDPLGMIQVPQNVYERLRHEFILEERGEVEVKGKGVMRDMVLVDRRAAGLRGRKPWRSMICPARAESRTSQYVTMVWIHTQGRPAYRRHRRPAAMAVGRAGPASQPRYYARRFRRHPPARPGARPPAPAEHPTPSPG